MPVWFAFSRMDSTEAFVACHPACGEVLRRRGLAIGPQRLNTLCAEHGIDPDLLLVELALVVEPTPEPRDESVWSTLPPTALVEVIERHHAYLRGELGRLVVLCTALLDQRDPTVRALLRWRRSLELHLRWEETSWFPRCRQVDGAGVVTAPPAHEWEPAELPNKHSLYTLLADLPRRLPVDPRAAVAAASAAACATGLAGDLRNHADLEDRWLVPAMQRRTESGAS